MLCGQEEEVATVMIDLDPTVVYSRGLANESGGGCIDDYTEAPKLSVAELGSKTVYSYGLQK